jgi:hypothetical protein
VGNLELTIILVIAIGGLGWLVARVVGGFAAGGESAARADALGSGAGMAAERLDTLRQHQPKE